jgi:hypothetical protein
MTTVQIELAKNAIVGIQERNGTAFTVEAFLATTQRGFLMHVTATTKGYTTLVKEMEVIKLKPELLRFLPVDGRQGFEIRVDVPSDWSESDARNTDESR